VSLSGWAEANVIIYGVSYFSASQSTFGVSAYGITESSINPFPVCKRERVEEGIVREIKEKGKKKRKGKKKEKQEKNTKRSL
jgi:hypothetical protein